MFYERSETILLFGLLYLHLDLFQFLHRHHSLHIQFCSYVFQGKVAPSSGRQRPSFDVYLETVQFSQAMHWHGIIVQ